MSCVAIILVNWNCWTDTVECLDSLLRLAYANFRIVVCDNDSRDDSVARIREWALQQQVGYTEYPRAVAEAGGDPAAAPLLTLIKAGANLGFAGGNNVALRHVLVRKEAGFCWLLNNDTVVEPDTLTHLVARMEQEPQVGICGSTIRYYDNRDRIQALGGGHYCHWIGLPWHYGRFSRRGAAINQARAESLMNYVEGASMLVSRPFLVQVGLLCEDYFLYFEEADWAARAKEFFRLGYAEKSVVYHKVGRSIGTDSNPRRKSLACDYYNIRNRMLFTRRFYPSALLAVRLVILAELLMRICLGKWDRVAMISRILLGKPDRQFDLQPEHCAKP